jgi:hypothetical protein
MNFPIVKHSSFGSYQEDNNPVASNTSKDETLLKKNHSDGGKYKGDSLPSREGQDIFETPFNEYNDNQIFSIKKGANTRVENYEGIPNNIPNLVSPYSKTQK